MVNIFLARKLLPLGDLFPKVEIYLGKHLHERVNLSLVLSPNNTSLNQVCFSDPPSPSGLPALMHSTHALAHQPLLKCSLCLQALEQRV